MANFSWAIPQSVVGANGIRVNLMADRCLYITVANLGPDYGGADTTVTVSWKDSTGAGQTATIISGSSFGPAQTEIRVLDIYGEGAVVIGSLATSPVSPESLIASAARVDNTIKTDVGQGEQITNNTTLYVHGTAIDPRGRIWNLGVDDLPGRGWTLGSSDAPDRSWSLSGVDSQGSAYVGTADAPYSGVWTVMVLGTGDTPGLSAGGSSVGSLQSGTLATGVLATYIVPVVAGTAYTIIGGTIKSGWISVT